MGLGPFADSSRGSVSSSKSGDQDEATGMDKSSEQVNPQEEEEEESNDSRAEEKMEEETGELPLPRVSTTSSDQHSMFTMRSSDGEGAERRGGAAFDDAVDGMEDDEDWHFALPVDTLDQVVVDGKKRQPGQEKTSNQENSLPNQSQEDQEEEQERERSSESPDTSHSSQGHTPDNSQGDHFKEFVDCCHIINLYLLWCKHRWCQSDDISSAHPKGERVAGFRVKTA